MALRFEWRGAFDDATLERLHAEAFERVADVHADWTTQLERHSLGWVCSYEADGTIVGFVNVAWDGLTHAFVLDTIVAAGARRRGIGRELVARAVAGARAAGCEWVHVDFEDHLRGFYFDSCGFTPTNAGLIALD